MTTIPALDTWLRRTRAVSVSDTGAVTISEVPLGPTFRAGIFPPTRGATLNGSPRASVPPTIVWYPALGVAPVSPGDRLTGANNETLEVLGIPGGKRAGVRVIVHEVEVLPVTVLYPYIGELTEQSGVAIRQIQFSMWSPTEVHRETGVYEDYEAEAALEYRDDIRRNAQIHMDGKIYRVLTVSIDLQVRHVSFRLRLSG